MRLVSRIRVVSLVAAGLVLVVAPALRAGSIPAAKGSVRIELRYTSGGEFNSAGRFVLSGALSDRGRFRAHHEAGSSVRRLDGAKGTIRVSARRGSWKIITGTKAYAGLQGGGRERFRPGEPILFVLTGTVSRSQR